MAKIIDNAKGFKVIEIDREELMDMFDGYGCLGVCDNCDKPSSKGFYVAVLNQWLCPKCYTDWCNFANRYPEDEYFEHRNFERYRSIFQI